MRPQDILLAGGMLGAGTINTIASKFQDSYNITGISTDPAHEFSHPAVQTLCMFFGETLCLIVFLIVTAREKSLYRKQYSLNTPDAPTQASFPPWVFAIPAMCDMTGSTLMYIGLLLTDPSVYQMLRGMIVVFTGLFSFLFLKRKLYGYHITGMVLITLGTFIVGLSSVIFKSGGSSAKNPLLGDMLVVAAQVVAATQMVVEEKFIGKYNVPPLQVVGNEGIWGVTVTSLLLFIAYWIPPIRSQDNSLDAVLQIYNSHALVGWLVVSILSIAFFNFFGISVTKQLSATHRTTVDATRVFLVWIFSLMIGWESFKWLQLVGFFVLLSGTALFNEIYRVPKLFVYPPPKYIEPVNNEVDPLLRKEVRDP